MAKSEVAEPRAGFDRDFAELRDKLGAIERTSLARPPDLDELWLQVKGRVDQAVATPLNPHAAKGTLDKLVDAEVSALQKRWKDGEPGDQHREILGRLENLHAEVERFAEARARAAEKDINELARVGDLRDTALARAVDRDVVRFPLPDRESGEPIPERPAGAPDGSPQAQVRPRSPRISPAPRINPGNTQEEVGRLAGPTWGDIVYYLVLTLAVGVDVAAFFQVFALAMRDVPEVVVWLGAGGFTAIALALAHQNGTRLRRHVKRRRNPLTCMSSWLLTAAWSLVGAVAFVIRAVAPPPSGGDRSEFTEEGVAQALDSAPSNILPALFFLSLYVATGAVTATVAFQHNPDASAFRRLSKQYDAVARGAERSEADRAGADGLLRATDNETRRREDAWKTALEHWEKYTDVLRERANAWAVTAQTP